MSAADDADEFYGDEQRELQQRFDSTRLADAVHSTIVAEGVSDEQRAFIESRDFFFLATVGEDGSPTTSYKGGRPGFVRVLDPTTIMFPNYDGNGMFLSMGNVAASSRIGMLFIDFATPNRVRVQATASLSCDPDDLAMFPGANLVVRAQVETAFLNCARYIHKMERVEESPYVPDAQGAQPYPSWKRIDLLQDELPERDRGRADEAGGTITLDEYAEKVVAGES